MNDRFKQQKDLLVRPDNLVLHSRYIEDLTGWVSDKYARPDDLFTALERSHLIVKQLYKELGDTLEDQYRTAKLMARALCGNNEPLRQFTIDFIHSAGEKNPPL